MAKRRGNPNWGKADSGPVLPVITEFEKITTALNDKGIGDQEGSDEGASAGFHGDGHPSV